MELKIESRNVAMTPRWKTEIETRMHDLQQRHEDLIHGRVTLMKNRHHKKLANVAEALVVVTLPGRHTITARKADKTFEEAIRASFRAVDIELRKYREKRAGTEVRQPSASPQLGGYSRLLPQQCYGFILKEEGGEAYFDADTLQGSMVDRIDDRTKVASGLAEGINDPTATVVSLPTFKSAKVSR